MTVYDMKFVALKLYEPPGKVLAAAGGLVKVDVEVYVTWEAVKSKRQKKKSRIEFFYATFQHRCLLWSYLMMSLCPFLAARCSGVMDGVSVLLFPPSPSNSAATMLLLSSNWATWGGRNLRNQTGDWTMRTEEWQNQSKNYRINRRLGDIYAKPSLLRVCGETEIIYGD